MSRSRDTVTWLAAPLFGGYLGAVTLGGLHSAVTRLGPVLEGALSPVVRIAPPDHVRRDKDRVCFDLRIVKLHAAVPMKYAFFAEAQLSDRIPVAAYLTDERRRRQKSADLVTHPVGDHWTRHYCFDLPQTIAGLDIRVTGWALHRRHPFYDTPTPIPSFNVAAVAGGW